MKKIKVAVIVGFLALASIIILIGTNQNTKAIDVEAMEQEFMALAPYISLADDKELKLSYQGVVSSSDEMNANLSLFTGGTHNFYYDSTADQVRKIESLADIDFEAAPVDKNEIVSAADELFVHAVGNDILNECVKTVAEDNEGFSYTMDYTYMYGDIQIAAGNIIYLYDGTLFYAYFLNMDVLEEHQLQSSSDTISQDEALAIAKAEAEEFMYPRVSGTEDHYILEESSIKYEKMYFDNHDCWKITLNYVAEGIIIPFYFDIFVDIYTGEIVYNANNFS